MLKELNRTNLVLIHKSNNPEKLSQFRPISLCNFAYKIISKTLANRLKIILPNIISINQSAFIPSRAIQDNVVLAQEMFHSLNINNSKANIRLALKIDLNKAYDRLECDFLLEVMRRMGFSERWIAIMSQCISSLSFNIIANSEDICVVHPKRGLRLGDRISPNLFLLVQEALSKAISTVVHKGDILESRIKRRCPSVSHLFLADDSLLFLKATLEECNNLKAILNSYCAASGQRINFSKSEAFFSKGCDDIYATLIGDFLGVTVHSKPGKYLGLPFCLGSSKNEALSFIFDRVR